MCLTHRNESTLSPKTNRRLTGGVLTSLAPLVPQAQGQHLPTRACGVGAAGDNSLTTAYCLLPSDSCRQTNTKWGW